MVEGFIAMEIKNNGGDEEKFIEEYISKMDANTKICDLFPEE